MRKLETRIDEYIKSLRKSWGSMDITTFQPFDYAEIEPYFAKQWVLRILELINKKEKVNLSDKEAAPLLHCPSKIRSACLSFEPFLAKIGGFEKETRFEIFNFFSKLLEIWCIEDPYAIKGKNLIHTESRIKKNFESIKKADPETAKKLSKVTNACYSLSYGLYSDMYPDILYENYGPYDVSKKFGPGHILIIKEYKNMRPVELWEEMRDFPYEKVRIVCAYKDVKFSVDSVSHTFFDGDVINGLKFYDLEVNDKKYDIDKVSELVNIISERATLMWQKLVGQTLEEKKTKYVHQKAYTYINICNKLNMDWKPSKSILEMISDKQLIKWPKITQTKPDFWVDMMDPRIELKDIKKNYKGYLPKIN